MVENGKVEREYESWEPWPRNSGAKFLEKQNYARASTVELV